MMAQINTIEFRNVIIDSTLDTILNVLTYSKENLSIYFSLQSVAQAINELLTKFTAKEIFHTDFYNKWHELNLQCMTEFEIQLLIPINLISEPSTEMFNPMPLPLINARYLNDRYQATVENFADYTSAVNDVFCIAERQGFTSGTTYYHKFMHAIGFISFISILKLRYIRILYKTFFLIDMINSADIEYIYETLVLNRKRMQPDDIANVLQLTADDIIMRPVDIQVEDKQLYVQRFNRACRTFKSFAFNIMDEQSLYISRNLQIVTQFGLDRNAVEKLFKKIPKVGLAIGTVGLKERYTPQQLELLCRESNAFDATMNNLTLVEINILHSLIKIHLMIQRMTNVRINRTDLEFYRKLLQTRYSIELDELISDMETLPNGGGGGADISRSYATLDDCHCLIKNYTIGEIIGEFVQLYVNAQQNISTIWLCRFIQMSCNPRYSNLVNIMADFVPYFQRFFTNDFNINSINNMIIFMQGMCRPDEDRIKSLKDFRELKQLDVKHFRSFSLTRYQAVNANPLVTFMDLVLTNRNTQNSYTLNLSALTEIERYNILSLIDPNEKKFIDYVYELVVVDDDEDYDHYNADARRGRNNETEDLSGDKRFNLQYIDYDSIVPVVSTNTFNENNTTIASLQLFNGIINQTTFFHELTNRTTYKVPGIVCNIVVK